jgi:rhomboid protease GluP
MQIDLEKLTPPASPAGDIILFVFGFIMPNVDNFAHLGGFLGGYAAARWLDPLRQERVDHLIAAIVCIAVTALSVVASVVTVYM